jgi:DMSO/TMAO reductase YedYZ molybdopterin-dependent catalytic subunit
MGSGMKPKQNFLKGALLGGITSLGVIGLFYLGKFETNLPFLPFDVFDWMARHLPGPIIAFGIGTMVQVISGLKLGPTASTAKLAEQSIAIFQFIVAGIVFGLVLTALTRRFPKRATVWGLIGSLILFGIGLLVEIQLGFPEAGVALTVAWMLILLFGWGWALSRVIAEDQKPTETVAPAQNASRRQFLGWLLSGSVGFALLAAGISYTNRKRTLPVTGAPPPPDQIPTQVADTSGPASSPPVAALNNRFQPVRGTRAELTPTDQFYRIDINTQVPTTNTTDWRLHLDGLVNQPLNLSLDEIRALPSVSEALTMSCISNEVGGDLIGSAVWTGVPFKTVLAKAGLKPNGQFFNVHAFDGFYESLGITEAMDERTLLVYEMNGEPLTTDHGFPLRIYIPNHYGMKQPKWIEHIEVVDSLGAGYWVDRGWSETAIPNTTSVIDTVVTNSTDPVTGTLSLGGIAWAGSRGINKVELQIDSGQWTEAQLRVPPLSQLTWVQWRLDFPYKNGRHTFRVRATDGTGQLQTTVNAPPEPSGATGIYEYTADL